MMEKRKKINNEVSEAVRYLWVCSLPCRAGSWLHPALRLWWRRSWGATQSWDHHYTGPDLEEKKKKHGDITQHNIFTELNRSVFKIRPHLSVTHPLWSCQCRCQRLPPGSPGTFAPAGSWVGRCSKNRRPGSRCRPRPRCDTQTDRLWAWEE